MSYIGYIGRGEFAQAAQIYMDRVTDYTNSVSYTHLTLPTNREV